MNEKKMVFLCPRHKDHSCPERNCGGLLENPMPTSQTNRYGDTLWMAECFKYGHELFQDLLPTEISHEPNSSETPSHKTPPQKKKGVKRGTGNMGRKTNFMAKQKKAFEDFLRFNKYDGDTSKLYSFAARCWQVNKKKWDRAKNAKGDEKGYSSSKVLADAYKKSR